MIKNGQMKKFNEINGDLLKLADEGKFNIIAHGCNCFNTMGGGIAKQIKEKFPKVWEADQETLKADIRKLGNFTGVSFGYKWGVLHVLNLYTQYNYSNKEPQFDYEAFTIVLRKINKIFKGMRIGLPQIGAGLAGGDWEKIKRIIKTELKDLKITIIYYKN